jgi:hypothetical protein
MHGEYWAQREGCQIVCIIRKAERYLDDYVMVCFVTDGRVLFGEVRAMQFCEWLSNCSESCHERQKSSSHSPTSPSMMLAKYRSRAGFHVSLQGMLKFSYQTRSSSDWTATIGRTTEEIRRDEAGSGSDVVVHAAAPAFNVDNLHKKKLRIQSVSISEPRFESGASRIRTWIIPPPPRSPVGCSKGKVVDDFRTSCWQILKFGSEHDKHFRTPRCVANLFTHISEKWLA